jgi:hypothetical protein
MCVCVCVCGPKAVDYRLTLNHMASMLRDRSARLVVHRQTTVHRWGTVQKTKTATDTLIHTNQPSALGTRHKDYEITHGR